MANLLIPNGLDERMMEFKQVLEEVLGEEISRERCAEILLSLGIHALMDDITGALDPQILQASFQQLGERYPSQVYPFIIENMRRGATEKEKERLRRRIGFHAQPGEDR